MVGVIGAAAETSSSLDIVFVSPLLVALYQNSALD